MHFVQAKGIISSSNGMNLYRGCQHGCIYCDSRSRCYQMDHIFEDIEVKQNALELMEQALKRKRTPCMIGTGSMTDPYMPLERELGMTRRALELIDRYGFGVSLLTKSDLVLRDMDLLKRINERSKAVVQMTLTTYDDTLCGILEPNVCPTSRRFEVLCRFRDAGIPTVVWISPILPMINDTRENVEGILDYCVRSGVTGVVCFGMGLTLREGSREYYYQALDRHFPGMKQEYIRRYGNRYELNSPRQKELMDLLPQKCREFGILSEPDAVFRYLREFPDREGETQLSLF